VIARTKFPDVEIVYGKIARRIMPFLVLVYVVAWLVYSNVGTQLGSHEIRLFSVKSQPTTATIEMRYGKYVDPSLFQHDCYVVVVSIPCRRTGTAAI
jgi:hypothetical protein